MKVLGIETSCDDTGVAIYDSNEGLIIHRLASQIELHRPYGGVVPELAARDHIRTLMPLIDTLLHDPKNRQHNIDAIAYTAGPGLAGALLAGASVANGLAYGWNVPVLGVHHMEGHLLVTMLENPVPHFPFIALLVSGGHTLLVDVQKAGCYRLLGQSLDDAAGEAFDKSAQLLGLEYPGGPAISACAALGDPQRFVFPRPMTNRPGLDFSFSGLKTFTRNVAAKEAKSQPKDDALWARLDPQTIADIALAFEMAVVDTLVIKCRRALVATGYQQLVVAGGVGANQCLRNKLSKLEQSIGIEVFFPKREFCTDNGAMIAYTGYLRLAREHSNRAGFTVKPRWSLEDLTEI